MADEKNNLSQQVAEQKAIVTTLQTQLSEAQSKAGQLPIIE